MKKITIILLFLLAIPVMGQNDDPGLTAFEALEVSNVRLGLSETLGITLIFNASPAVCEGLLIDVTVDEQSVVVNVFAPQSDTVCNTFAPYEPVIALPELDTEQAYLLYLNDFTSTFFLTERQADPSTEPYAVRWGRENTLIGFNPVEPLLDSIDFTAGDDGVLLALSGNHPDGCETQEFTRVYQDSVQANLYHVDSFRLIPEEVMCPAVLMAFEAEVELAISNGDIVEIDGRYFKMINGEAVEVSRNLLAINDVEILSGVNGNIVVVTGSRYCNFPVQSYGVERDFMSMIDIVAYAPLDEPCAVLSPVYDEGFIVESLPVVINGIAYDENGEINPTASAQSDNLPQEGNGMPVDTVIESVEVTILESFPMQLQLTVSGYQPDGCDFPVEVEQSVDGNDVTLHIYRNVPSDVMCPMNLEPYDETIDIEGEFSGGTVNIQVNEFTTSVDL